MNGFWAMFRKELTQMLRDRGTLFFAIAVPVFELILFGVIDMNAKNIPTVDLRSEPDAGEPRADRAVRQHVATCT